MKKLVALSLVFILGTGCKNAGGAIAIVTELRLADNIVAGWQEDTARFATFDTATFYELIDGGAPAYIDEGLVDGFTQAFFRANSPDTFNCKIYVMDFSSPVNSLRMFGKIKSEQNSPIALTGFDTTVAMASEFLGGYYAFAAFDRFFIEVSVSGYADLDLALNDAKSFMNVFKTRIPSASINKKRHLSKGNGNKKLSGYPTLDLKGRRLPQASGKPSGAIVGQDKKAGTTENKIMVK